MSYSGENISENYNAIIAHIENAATATGKASQIKQLRAEAFSHVFGLVAEIMASDGVLTRSESDCLNEIFGENETLDYNISFIQHLAGKWSEICETVPEFFSMVVAFDVKQGTGKAYEVIEAMRLCSINAAVSGGADGKKPDQSFDIFHRYSCILEDFIQQAQSQTTEFCENDRKEIPLASGERKQPLETPPKSLDELLEELNGLIGLSAVKQDVTGLINLIRVRKLRHEKGMQAPPLSLHLVFSGNPGTGKTTVARLLAQIYRAMGLLSKGHLVEADRSGLVAGYVGQTAIKVRDLAKTAFGGVLFIDEAYTLSSSKGENDYGREAIDTLLKLMEDRRDDFVVIVAGYSEEMRGFLQSNPGLQSRFNKFIHFEDYGPEELYEIFVKFCTDGGYTYDESCGHLASSLLRAQHEVREEHFGNARAVRNLFEHTISNHANRVAQMADPSEDDLRTILADDLPAGASFHK